MATFRSSIKFCALSAFAAYGWLRLKLVRSPTLIILTYHRVLPKNDPEREVEQPGMVVSPSNLKQHIKIIRSLGATPTHLDDWLQKRKAGAPLPALSVAFTFDDGWRDNYLHGYPVLRKAGIPATIFLVTGMIDTPDTFWPEQVIKLLRAPDINLNDSRLNWLHPYLGDFSKRATPLSLMEADEVINRLKDLDDATIIQKLKNLNTASPDYISGNQTIKTWAILRSEELKEMAGGNLIKFGAHTRNHFRLNRLNSKQALEEQILGCQADLNEMQINSVPIFCYPNGDITKDGEQLVEDNYTAACTTKTGWNRADRNEFDLHRFNLHDGNSSSPRRLLATIGRSLV